MPRGSEQNQDDQHNNQGIHDFSTSSDEISMGPAQPLEPQMPCDREKDQDQEDDDKRFHVGDLPEDEPIHYTRSLAVINLAAARSHTVRSSTL